MSISVTSGNLTREAAFERLESEVRRYCRLFPTVFDHARGAYLFDEDGRAYLDFLSGAGALNYGHNHPLLKRKLLEYVERDGVILGLDMFTTAKRTFLERFEEVILKPRGLEYKLQFPGPTGTNAVEAALKLARKVTGRHLVVSFTHAFHGMTLGALAVTASEFHRAGAGVPLGDTIQLPFDTDGVGEVDGVSQLERLVSDASSGNEKPGAVILETVQCEGGIRIASPEWLRRLSAVCRSHGILMILDDIQVGCGRTGPFFSFENSGVLPDIVCLSKSLSGGGLPLALNLLRPVLDVWNPGEHSGTFRGNGLGLVTATAALSFWEDGALAGEVSAKGARVGSFLSNLTAGQSLPNSEVRGRGLVWGVECRDPSLAKRACQAAFQRGLVMETAGPRSTVLKIMPPLLIDDSDLDRGLEVIADSLRVAVRG